MNDELRLLHACYRLWRLRRWRKANPPAVVVYRKPAEADVWREIGQQFIAIERGTEIDVSNIQHGHAFYVPAKAELPKRVWLEPIPSDQPRARIDEFYPERE